MEDHEIDVFFRFLGNKTEVDIIEQFIKIFPTDIAFIKRRKVNLRKENGVHKKN